MRARLCSGTILVATLVLLLCGSCTARRHATHEELAKALDALPLPDEFRFIREHRYQFNDGPQGDKANAVARYYDPGKLKNVFAAVRAAFAAEGQAVTGVEAADPRQEARIGRVQTSIGDASVVVFTSRRPVEVRAYD